MSFLGACDRIAYAHSTDGIALVGSFRQGTVAKSKGSKLVSQFEGSTFPQKLPEHSFQNQATQRNHEVFSALIASLFTVATLSTTATNAREEPSNFRAGKARGGAALEQQEPRELKSKGKGKGKSKSKSADSFDDGDIMSLQIINQAFMQPLSPFFVMVHSSKITPLYIRGQPASPELKNLAENGDASDLVDMYEGMDGVKEAFVFSVDAPFFPGQEVAIPVSVPEGYRVTIASMAINTNDCFVAINGMELSPGMVLDLPGLDAGTEENNEDCSSIPGPLCAGSPGNDESGNGEGIVHVHRGVAGIGDLDIVADWRNPMTRVVVS